MEQRYTLDQLATETGVPARRIRAWIQAGVVPYGDANGRYGAYTYRHVRRIREVVELRDQNRTLEDLRDMYRPIIPEAR